MDTVLANRLHRQIGDAELFGRLCDRQCCVTDAVCPVGQAERDTGN